jgi:hypothetical protein
VLELRFLVTEVQPVIVEAAFSNSNDLVTVRFDQLGKISNVLEK